LHLPRKWLFVLFVCCLEPFEQFISYPAAYSIAIKFAYGIMLFRNSILAKFKYNINSYIGFEIF
jgi:hypothetical protein